MGEVADQRYRIRRIWKAGGMGVAGSKRALCHVQPVWGVMVVTVGAEEV